MASAVAHEAHDTHEHTHYTSTGLENRKVAIWAFIGSECMLFASLISTYLIYKGKSVVGPFPHTPWTAPDGHVFVPILDIPVTSQSTFVLLMSSLAMVLALAAVENRGKPGYVGTLLGNSKLWLASTAALGATFLCYQGYEFTSFVHKGLTIHTNLFGSTFFTLTGFHGAHVFGGAVGLTILLARSLGGQFSARNHIAVEAISMYWHFVDVVWIALFTTLYFLR